MRTSQLTATEAATIARTTVRTIRTWCRSGLIHAVKVGGRWAIGLGQLARVICAPTDRPRRGENQPTMTARAAQRAAHRAEARRTADEHGTRVIGHQQRARIAAANSGYVLARDYLAELTGDEAFTAKYESAFGRKVAQVYRQRHGVDPNQGGLVVLRGKLWHVFRYADVRDLHAGAAQYARTRALFEAAA